MVVFLSSELPNSIIYAGSKLPGNSDTLLVELGLTGDGDTWVALGKLVDGFTGVASDKTAAAFNGVVNGVGFARYVKNVHRGFS